jgi:hypothetical protein
MTATGGGGGGGGGDDDDDVVNVVNEVMIRCKLQLKIATLLYHINLYIHFFHNIII